MCIMKPSGPAAQRPSGPAAQRPSGPAGQRPSGVTCARRQAEARKPAQATSVGPGRPDPRTGRAHPRRLSLLLVLALLLVALGLGHTKPAIAEVLVSNVGETAGVSDDVHKVATSASAQGFTTGANAEDYTVTSIDVVFQVAVGTPANLRVELWASRLRWTPSFQVQEPGGSVISRDRRRGVRCPGRHHA